MFEGDVNTKGGVEMKKNRLMKLSLVLFVTGWAMLPIGRTVSAAPRTRPANAGVPKKVSLGDAQTISKPFVVRAATPTLEERGRAALRLLGFDYADAFPGWTISFLPGRDRLLGLTLVGERRVEIYIRKDRPAAGLAHDIAHEFGHIVDVSYNTEKIRARYLVLRRLPAGTPWWACNSCRDLEVGAGDFAEVFAHLVAPRFAFYSRVKGVPDAETSEAIRTEVLPLALRLKPSSVEPGPGSEVPAESTAAKVTIVPAVTNVATGVATGETIGTAAPAP
jgi:hypothetical protein